MDIATGAGIGLAFVAVLLSMVMEGGNPAALVTHPAPILLVIGGTLGATMAGYDLKDVTGIAKVAMNVLLRRTFQAMLQLTGQVTMVDDPDAAVVEPYLHLPAELIGGGTREIQLNIIAQMILGLPRK